MKRSRKMDGGSSGKGIKLELNNVTPSIILDSHTLTIYSICIFIIAFVAFIFLFYISYKANTKYSNNSLIDYLKTTIFSVTQKLPLKWFDWMKFILIIGAFSVFEEKSHDQYLQIIIVISYAAILFDSYNFMYNSYNDIFCRPTYAFFRYLNDNKIKQSDDLLKQLDDTIKQSNDEIRQSDDEIRQSDDIIKQYEDTMERMLIERKISSEDLQKQKDKLQKLTDELQERKDGLQKGKIDLQKRKDELEKYICSMEKSLPIVGLIFSAAITFSIYLLVNYLVEIYIVYSK